jgi:DNA-binding response OmpR family regulator
MAVEPERVVELEDQIVLLTQQLAAFKGSSQELGVLMALGLGMTHRLATMLYILVKRAPAVISRNTFHTVIYGDRSDGGPEPKIFDVHISRLRSVLRRLKCPGKIDTIWNAGYVADPALVKWVNELYSQQIPKE